MFFDTLALGMCPGAPVGLVLLRTNWSFCRPSWELRMVSLQQIWSAAEDLSVNIVLLDALALKTK